MGATVEKSRKSIKATPVHVRQLAALPAEKIWRTKGLYSVTFDDGVTVDMPARYIKLSWPYWGVTRSYKDVPIPSTLALKVDAPPSDDLHLDLMSLANKLGRETGVPLKDLRFILSQHIYADAFNLTVDQLLAYCTTLDVDTMMEISDHPEFQIIYEWKKMYPTGYDEEGRDMVEEAYKIIERIMRDPALRKNTVVMSVLDRTIKTNQVLQAYIRGKGSEIDSRIYTNQIWDGFFEGLNLPADRLKESGAASRAHIYNTANIATSEYASRKYQLIANVLMGFYYGDCGTKHVHHYTFRDTTAGRKEFNGCVGMSFRKAGTTAWKPIEKGMWADLIDKPVEIRSTMCCEGLRHQMVCSTCLGEIAYNYSELTSPGMVAVTSVAEKGSQGILSTKHLDFLRKLLALVLNHHVRQYMDEFRHKSQKALVLNRKPEFGTWEDYELAIPTRIHAELGQVSFYENLDDVDETTLPDINDLIFVRKMADGSSDMDAVDVRMGICGNFSKHFLQYYLQRREDIQVADKHAYLPMDKWNHRWPIVVYTNRSESMAEFVSALETKIRSVAADRTDEDSMENALKGTGHRVGKNGMAKPITLVEQLGSTEEQCTRAMFDMFRYINRKLDGIPMTHVATLLAVTRVESYDNAFPAVGFDEVSDPNGKHFVDHNRLMVIRSLAPMLIFQQQQRALNDVSVYVDRERPASLFDGVFKTIVVND